MVWSRIWKLGRRRRDYKEIDLSHLVGPPPKQPLVIKDYKDVTLEDFKAVDGKGLLVIYIGDWDMLKAFKFLSSIGLPTRSNHVALQHRPYMKFEDFKIWISKILDKPLELWPKAGPERGLIKGLTDENSS